MPFFCPSKLFSSHIWFKQMSQVQGKFYLRIDPLGEGAKWRRSFGQEIYSPLLLAFTEQVTDGPDLISFASMIFLFILKRYLHITGWTQRWSLSSTNFYRNWSFLQSSWKCRPFNSWGNIWSPISSYPTLPFLDYEQNKTLPIFSLRFCLLQELANGKVLLRLAHLYEVCFYLTFDQIKSLYDWCKRI